MNTKFPAALAILLLASPAVAMTQKTPAQSKSPTSTSKTIVTKKPTLHARTHHHRVAKKVAMRGHREVMALNALESNGYRRFANLHPQGSDFVATADKNGKSYDVTVTPSGTIQAKQA